MGNNVRSTMARDMRRHMMCIMMDSLFPKALQRRINSADVRYCWEQRALRVIVDLVSDEDHLLLSMASAHQIRVF